MAVETTEDKLNTTTAMSAPSPSGNGKKKVGKKKVTEMAIPVSESSLEVPKKKKSTKNGSTNGGSSNSNSNSSQSFNYNHDDEGSLQSPKKKSKSKATKSAEMNKDDLHSILEKKLEREQKKLKKKSSTSSGTSTRSEDFSANSPAENKSSSDNKGKKNKAKSFALAQGSEPLVKKKKPLSLDDSAIEAVGKGRKQSSTKASTAKPPERDSTLLSPKKEQKLKAVLNSSSTSTDACSKPTKKASKQNPAMNDCAMAISPTKETKPKVPFAESRQDFTPLSASQPGKPKTKLNSTTKKHQSAVETDSARVNKQQLSSKRANTSNRIPEIPDLLSEPSSPMNSYPGTPRGTVNLDFSKVTSRRTITPNPRPTPTSTKALNTRPSNGFVKVQIGSSPQIAVKKLPMAPFKPTTEDEPARRSETLGTEMATKSTKKTMVSVGPLESTPLAVVQRNETEESIESSQKQTMETRKAEKTVALASPIPDNRSIKTQKSKEKASPMNNMIHLDKKKSTSERRDKNESIKSPRIEKAERAPTLSSPMPAKEDLKAKKGKETSRGLLSVDQETQKDQKASPLERTEKKESLKSSDAATMTSPKTEGKPTLSLQTPNNVDLQAKKAKETIKVSASVHQETPKGKKKASLSERKDKKESIESSLTTTVASPKAESSPTLSPQAPVNGNYKSENTNESTRVSASVNKEAQKDKKLSSSEQKEKKQPIESSQTEIVTHCKTEKGAIVTLAISENGDLKSQKTNECTSAQLYVSKEIQQDKKLSSLERKEKKESVESSQTEIVAHCKTEKVTAVASPISENSDLKSQKANECTSAPRSISKEAQKHKKAPALERKEKKQPIESSQTEIVAHCKTEKAAIVTLAISEIGDLKSQKTNEYTSARLSVNKENQQDKKASFLERKEKKEAIESQTEIATVALPISENGEKHLSSESEVKMESRKLSRFETVPDHKTEKATILTSPIPNIIESPGRKCNETNGVSLMAHHETNSQKGKEKLQSEPRTLTTSSQKETLGVKTEETATLASPIPERRDLEDTRTEVNIVSLPANQSTQKDEEKIETSGLPPASKRIHQERDLSFLSQKHQASFSSDISSNAESCRCKTPSPTAVEKQSAAHQARPPLSKTETGSNRSNTPSPRPGLRPSLVSRQKQSFSSVETPSNSPKPPASLGPSPKTPLTQSPKERFSYIPMTPPFQESSTSDDLMPFITPSRATNNRDTSQFAASKNAIIEALTTPVRKKKEALASIDRTPRTLKRGFVELNVMAPRKPDAKTPGQRVMDTSHHGRDKARTYIDAALDRLDDDEKVDEVEKLVQKIEALGGFPKTRRLSLRDNELVGQLVMAVRNDPRITEVHVDAAMFGTISSTLLSQFIDSLRINLHVKSLSFRGLELGNDFLYDLAASMEYNFVVEHIDLSQNCFTNEGLANFCQALAVTNESVRHLNLKNQTTPISEASQVDVIEAFEQNTSLTKIELDFISDDGPGLLEQIMERNRSSGPKQTQHEGEKLINVLTFEAERAQELWDQEQADLHLLEDEEYDWEYFYELALLFDKHRLKKEVEENAKVFSGPPIRTNADDLSAEEKKKYLFGEFRKSMEDSVMAFNEDGSFLTHDFIAKYLKERPEEGALDFDFHGQWKLFKRFPIHDPARQLIVDKFVQAIARHPRANELTGINMANTGAGDDFLVSLSELCLADPSLLPCLHTVNFETNFINEPGVVALANLIASPTACKYMQVIRLENQKGLLKSKAEFALAKAMRVNRSIVVISLTIRNLLERERIGKYIMRNVDLIRQARQEHMKARGLQRTRNKVERVFDSVRENNENLLKVDMKGNERFLTLTQEERIKAAQSFAHNIHVKELLLDGCGIDDAFAQALGESFVTNSAIQKVCMEVNDISGEGIKALFKGLGKNKSIKELRLHKQSKLLASSDEELLPDFLEGNTTITKIGMDLRSKMVQIKLDQKTRQNISLELKERAAAKGDDTAETSNVYMIRF